MPPRAGIVITGTEVVAGRVRDLNGPWLSDRLSGLGVEVDHIAICGDRAEHIEAQLSFMAGRGLALVVASGGLGPTADDLTAEVVARFAGRALTLDEGLERRIGETLTQLWGGGDDLRRDALRTAGRKQATVPEGAAVLDPPGTAPGLVVPPASGRGPTVVALPGPPGEVRALWPRAVATEAFRAAVGGSVPREEGVMRLFGIPESELAETLRAAQVSIEGFGGLEVTTCLRRGEVEVAARYEPASRGAWERLRELVAERHREALFSTDGSLVDDQVAELLGGRRLAVAESCTGGLMASRLTERAGASRYVVGGAVAYANEAKAGLLGVDRGLIERHGAVSPQVADAMAGGALARFGADTGLAITGVAGPGGGTAAKPVGYVCWSAQRAGGTRLGGELVLPGNRAEIRDRSTTVGMHLLRRLLRGEKSPI